jgi:hypothetical protein
MNELLGDGKKIIYVDFSVFLHRAIFAWESMRKQEEIAKETGTLDSNFFNSPPTYKCMSMIISCLSYVGAKLTDKIIIVQDGRGNWRKTYDKNYKANRLAIKQADQIDWKKQYADFEVLIEKLKLSTPFDFIRVDTLEADDIISVGVRTFTNNINIIISSDSDFQQLLSFKHVRIFSPVSKKYKFVANPYKLLASKIQKEKTDNLESPLLNEADFNIRYTIVNLCQLPDFVEKLAKEPISKIDINRNREYNIELFPSRSLKERLSNIHNSNKIINYEKSLQKEFKIKKKKKNSKGDETNAIHDIG